MPSENEVFEKEKIEINLDNNSLIDYLEEQKQLELEKQELIKEEEETLSLEIQQTEEQLLQDEVKFREDLLKELKDIKKITYESSLKNDEFNLMIYNEQINFHNDFYIFLGLFVTAFVVLIFTKGWFGNAL